MTVAGRHLSSESAVPRVIGTAPAFLLAVRAALDFAPTALPILILGETGTGKEVLATAVHAASRRPGPFVDVNCAAIPREMIETTLFGHRRGAFTGAHDDSAGLMEAADRGTLFLDELQSMSAEAQPKLLRVLESGELRRVGELAKRRVGVRVIAAAHPSILSAMEHGGFRSDLLQRLAGVVVRLPALAERRQDIRPLAEHFADRAGARLTDLASRMLEDTVWPGNVRELRMVVERAAHLSEAGVVDDHVVRRALDMRLIGAVDHSADPAVSGLPTRERVVAACMAHEWNAEATARALGLGRTTFFKHLRALGISLRAERGDISHRV